MTEAEVILWSRLRCHPLAKFRRQHPIGCYVADLAWIAARLVVEVDGETHGSDEERAYDAARDKYRQARGWSVLRVWNRDVYSHLGRVMDVIDGHLPPLP